MRQIAILGSTGSIGTSTLKVASHLRDQIEVVALASRSNISLLREQMHQFRPKVVAVFDEEKARELQRLEPSFRVLSGMEGMIEVALMAEQVVVAIVGAAALIPTIEAIKAGKKIALASKEVLVAAGEIVMQLAKKHGAIILPVDSEHSALFQCLLGEERKSIARLIITASGGPFRDVQDLEGITVEDALKHPTWKMGAKITVDCSTLMNKGLEVIEAKWLFDVPVEKVEVVIHPQSIIHSMVEFVDGPMIAQLSEPDMITPIQYALTYPKREKGLLKPFDFSRARHLEFFPPNFSRFPCLQMACEAARVGGSSACYLNAANEVLVSRFLNREIAWISIGEKLNRLMNQHKHEKAATIDEVLDIDAKGRREAVAI